MHAAFCRLLERKRYSRITVQDILDEADVGRSTFYAHYAGKDDLLAEVVDDICAHAIAPVGPEDDHDFTHRTDPASIIEHMLRHIEERGSEARAVIASEGVDMFARHLRESIARQADAALPSRLTGAAGAVDRAILVNHVAGSLVEIVSAWARSGFAADARALAESYLTLIRPLFGE